MSALAALPAGWLASVIVRRFDGGLPPRRLAAALIGGLVLCALWAAWRTPPGPIFGLSLVLGWTLIPLAVIDARVFRLPDLLTAPLAVAGLVACFWMPDAPLGEHVLGAGAGYLAFAALSWTYRRLRGRDGLGAGDAKLMGAAGAWLGLAPLLSVVLFASVAALALAALLALARRGRADAVLPFGPPLCLGIWMVWLYGPLSLPGA